MQSEISDTRSMIGQLGLGSIEEGGLSIFCGAGVSIHSGLPPANALKRYILDTLTDNIADINLLMEARIPFESFVERLFQNYHPVQNNDKVAEYKNKIEQEQDDERKKTMEVVLALLSLTADLASQNINSSHGLFLNLFSDKSLYPNQNHFLIARLAKVGFIKTVVTTNFDCLIELACTEEKMIRNVDFRVVYDENEFGKADKDGFSGLFIYKIHGSAENFESVRTTLQHVANQKLSFEREKLIKDLFQQGKHRRVLVMGYSCSDFFDISPVIQNIRDNQKEIVFLDHADVDLTAAPLADIPETDSKKVFKHYSGVWLRGRTEEFVKAMWETHQETIGSIPSSKQGPSWKSLLNPWKQDLSQPSNALSRIFIISLLMESAACHERSIEYINMGIELAETQNNQIALSALYSNLSASYGSLGEIAKAQLSAQKAIEYAQKTNSRFHIAQNIIGMAVSLMMHGKTEEAIQKYEEALQIGEELDDNEIRVTCYADLANAYTSLDPKKAEDYALKVTDLAKVRPTPAMMKAQSRAETLLCRIFSAQNNLQEASKHADEAIRLSQLLGDEQEIMMAMVSLAATLNDQGHENDAESYFLKALPLTEKTGNKLLECVCTFWIGKLSVDYTEARRTYSLFLKNRIEKSFSRSIEIARELGTSGAVALSLYFWARFRISLGEYDEAESMILEAMGIFTKTGEENNYSACEELLQIVKNYKLQSAHNDSLKTFISTYASASLLPAKKWWQFWKK